MTITYTCDRCHKPAHGSHSWVTLDRRSVDDYRHAAKQWEATHAQPLESGVVMYTGTAVLEHPTVPRWHVYHAACDTGGRDDYWTALDTADTAEELLAWSAHLHDEQWFAHTAWGAFSRKHTLHTEGTRACSAVPPATSPWAASSRCSWSTRYCPASHESRSVPRSTFQSTGGIA